MKAPKHHELRHDPERAQQVLEDLLPEPETQRQVLSILAAAIARAHRISPASWGITLDSDRICLNVGRAAVMQVMADKVRLIVLKTIFESLEPDAQNAFLRTNQIYKFVPGALEGDVLDKNLEHYAVFERAHQDLIERAALNRRVCFWPDAHSPGVVMLLNHLGFAVPSPVYFANLNDVTLEHEPLEPDAENVLEGVSTVASRAHVSRERSLRDKKIQAVLKEHQCLACEVCGFDFQARYGVIGEGFAEVHHLLPIHRGERLTRLADLAVVCANCHRMLHRPSGEPLGVAEMQCRLRNI